jgi:UDP-3-O-[3-hydroxymyristoyl] glucosamine N-acyltransferase
MVSVRLDTLAELVTGDLRGAADCTVRGAHSIEKAGPEEITFAGDEANLARLRTSRAAAAIVPRSLADSPKLTSLTIPLILVDDPRAAFLAVLAKFKPRRPRREIGISPRAYVAPSAKVGAGTNVYPGAHVDEDAVIGERCEVHPGAVVGAGCRIGDDCTIHPRAVLYPDVLLGRRVIVQAGAVIGADGYGYRLVNGRHEKIPHFGTVRLADDVEIGANATIDRAMIGETVIGEGTKIDNLVVVAHNCEIGRHNLHVAQVGLAGSVTTGDYVVCAGQVGVADHVHLGDRCVLGAKAAVHKNIPAGETWLGHPAMPVELSMKVMMAAKKLPAMREQLRTLQAQVNALEEAVRSQGDDGSTRDAA